MGCNRTITARLPLRELEIRRRCACDAHFRSICMDYEDAAAALCYWQTVTEQGDRRPEGMRRVQEYAVLLGELEAEVLARLSYPASDAR